MMEFERALLDKKETNKSVAATMQFPPILVIELDEAISIKSCTLALTSGLWGLKNPSEPEFWDIALTFAHPGVT